MCSVNSNANDMGSKLSGFDEVGSIQAAKLRGVLTQEKKKPCRELWPISQALLTSNFGK